MDDNRNGKNPWQNEYGNQNQEDPGQHAPDQLDPRYNLAVLAVGLGVASIVLCMSGGFGLILAGVAIMLALLSKGRSKKMLVQGTRAIGFAVIGIIAGYSVMISSVHTVMTDPQMHQQLNDMSEQMNGISFDDMLQQIEDELGISFGNTV